MKKIIGNPNCIYILAFMLPFAVYTLQWSTIYPKLTTELFLFYLFTFAVCLVLAINIQFTKPFSYTAIAPSSRNKSMLIGMYGFYLVEAIYSRDIPLVSAVFGSFNYDAYDFGIPVVHTFLISFNTFFAIFIFHQYISTRKLNLFVLFLFALLPLVLFLTRSSIIHVLLGSFFVFLFSRRNLSYKIFLKSAVGILLVLFLFGVAGDLRSNNLKDPTFIARVSGATDKFLESAVPKQFYWSYLYIASPVANLQNNINLTTVPEGSYADLVLNEFLPTFLVKFILPPQERSFHQINSFLNVGTIYVFSFSYLRWKGIFLMFFYFIGLINLYYFLLMRSDTYKVTGLAILCNIIIFANFHNTIAYSVISLQLIYPLIFSMLKQSEVTRTGNAMAGG